MQVSKEDRRFQLLIFFDFSETDWMNFPIIVEQINLPFGVKQAGIFLELVLYEVGSQATSSLATSAKSTTCCTVSKPESCCNLQVKRFIIY